MAEFRNSHIFIIDDDWDDRDFIIDALRKEGAQNGFAQFENGIQLSEYLSSKPDKQPDLILLDLNMPLKNGYDTLKELKADDSWKTIPVVIFTASTKSNDRTTCLALGCDHFINKPVTASGYDDVARFLHISFFPAV